MYGFQVFFDIWNAATAETSRSFFLLENWYGFVMKAARFLAVFRFLFLVCSASLSDEIYLRFPSRRSFSPCFSSSLTDLNAFLSFFSSCLSYLILFSLRFGWRFGTSLFLFCSTTPNRSLPIVYPK